MGRSIETVTNATEVIYLHGLCETDIEDDPHGDIACEYFEDECAIISSMVERRYPSMQAVSGSDRRSFLPGHRETIILAENDHAIVTISEYMGLVAVCLVPRPEIDDRYYGDPGYNLAYAWCNRVADGFRKLFEQAYPTAMCVKLGTMSNGGSVYRPIAS